MSFVFPAMVQKAAREAVGVTQHAAIASLDSRRTAENGFVAVIQEAYVHGVPSRPGDHSGTRLAVADDHKALRVGREYRSSGALASAP